MKKEKRRPFSLPPLEYSKQPKEKNGNGKGPFPERCEKLV